MGTFAPQQQRGRYSQTVNSGRVASQRQGRKGVGLTTEITEMVSNQTMQRLLNARVIQAKLKVSQPDDKCEREADRVADQIMRMPDPRVSRKRHSSLPDKTVRLQHSRPTNKEELQLQPTKSRNGEDEHAVEEKKKQIQRKEVSTGDPAVTPEVDSAVEGIKDDGRSLSVAEREFFEPRFEHDFSHVRINTGSQASESARSINAEAYTLNNHIVVGTPGFTSNTSSALHLIAHELVHVVQQGNINTPNKYFTHSYSVKTDNPEIESKERHIGDAMVMRAAPNGNTPRDIPLESDVLTEGAGQGELYQNGIDFWRDSVREAVEGEVGKSFSNLKVSVKRRVVGQMEGFFSPHQDELDNDINELNAALYGLSAVASISRAVPGVSAKPSAPSRGVNVAVPLIGSMIEDSVNALNKLIEMTNKDVSFKLENEFLEGSKRQSSYVQTASRELYGEWKSQISNSSEHHADNMNSRIFKLVILEPLKSIFKKRALEENNQKTERGKSEIESLSRDIFGMDDFDYLGFEVVRIREIRKRKLAQAALITSTVSTMVTFGGVGGAATLGSLQGIGIGLAVGAVVGMSHGLYVGGRIHGWW